MQLQAKVFEAVGMIETPEQEAVEEEATTAEE